MNTLEVSIGARVRIIKSRKSDRVGKLATIIGHRRPGRSPTGDINYVHPVDIDGVGSLSENGKPLALEDGTFEVIEGEVIAVNDTMSAAYNLKLLRTGDVYGLVGKDGIARLDDE